MNSWFLILQCRYNHSPYIRLKSSSILTWSLRVQLWKIDKIDRISAINTRPLWFLDKNISLVGETCYVNNWCFDFYLRIVLLLNLGKYLSHCTRKPPSWLCFRHGSSWACTYFQSHKDPFYSLSDSMSGFRSFTRTVSVLLQSARMYRIHAVCKFYLQLLTFHLSCDQNSG